MWLGGRGPHPPKYVLFLVDLDAVAAAVASGAVDAAPLAALAYAASALADRFHAWRSSPAAAAAPSEFREMGALSWAPLAAALGCAGSPSLTGTRTSPAAATASLSQSHYPLSGLLQSASADPLMRAWVRNTHAGSRSSDSAAVPLELPSPQSPGTFQLRLRAAPAPAPSPVKPLVPATAPLGTTERDSDILSPAQASQVLQPSKSGDEVESALALLMSTVSLGAPVA